MTVGMLANEDGDEPGSLQTVTAESPGADGEVNFLLSERQGEIHADLTMGATVSDAGTLISNQHLCFRGVTRIGAGFWVDRDDEIVPLERAAIKPLINGKDLTQIDRRSLVIDLYVHTEASARSNFPHCYQRLLNSVKPERDQSQRASYRQRWWIFAERRPELRAAMSGLGRYIASSMTAKHRVFLWVNEEVVPDQGVVVVASASAYALGVVSSSAHVAWAVTAGGRLGVGNDPRYNQTRCFETFPFPTPETGLTLALSARIASLAEDIDAHRKRVLSAGNALTLTGLYNVLEALREGRVLTAKEKVIHDAGLVAVLKSLHDELDAAVLAAYGWANLNLPRDEQTLLALLFALNALNAQRVDMEANGNIAYLRAEYQNPALRGVAVEVVAEQTTLAIETPQASDAVAAPKQRTVAKARKLTWPRTLPELMKTIATLLTGSAAPLTTAQVAACIGGKADAKSQLPDILATLVALGRAQQVNETQFAAV